MCKEFEMIPAELWPSGGGFAQDIKILHLMPSSEKKKFPQQSLARGNSYMCSTCTWRPKKDARYSALSTFVLLS